MEFIPLFRRHDAAAWLEMRSVTFPRNNTWCIPPGTYALVESFCDEDDCDCRKVMVAFLDTGSGQIIATIGYGWESAEYYTTWMLGDYETGVKLAGSYIELGARQSAHSHACLAWWKDMITSDEKYRERIHRHYRLFKNQQTHGG